jgi:hypothetical protein
MANTEQKDSSVKARKFINTTYPNMRFYINGRRYKFKDKEFIATTKEEIKFLENNKYAK